MLLHLADISMYHEKTALHGATLVLHHEGTLLYREEIVVYGDGMILHPEKVIPYREATIMYGAATVLYQGKSGDLPVTPTIFYLSRQYPINLHRWVDQPTPTCLRQRHTRSAS